MASTTSGVHNDAETVPALRQPRRVEQYGVEPVPPSERTVAWYDIFVIILNVLLNPGNILVGGSMIAAGLSVWGALIAVTAGTLISYLAYTAMATIGVDHGVPGNVATRMTFGNRASRFGASALRVVASVYWFAFQSVAGALGLVAVVGALFDVHPPFEVVALAFAIVQVLVALFGYESVKHLSRFAFPIKFAITIGLIVLLMTHSAPGFAPGGALSFNADTTDVALIALWANTIAAGSLSLITDASDYARYCRSRADMWAGTIAAAVIGGALMVAFGAYAAAATRGEDTSAFDVVAAIANDQPLILVALALLILLDNWTINVLNLYTGGMALVNIASKLGRFWATAIISVFGVAFSIFPELIDGYADAMNVVGSIFAPIAAVLVADYVFVKKLRVDVASLYRAGGRYWYWNGINWLAVAWVVAGYFIYKAIPAGWVPTATGLCLISVGYIVSSRMLRARIPILGEAATVPDSASS